MNCPSCNTKCFEESNFCHICGTRLNLNNSGREGIITNPTNTSKTNEEITQVLKRLMPTSYVEKLLASEGKMEGERRVVTILFSDIKGSTSLGEKLDPEEVLNIMNGAFEALIKPIMHYEGTLARLMGDAILAFFGAPIAHEDDPQRACRAAIEIIDGVNKYAEKIKDEKNIEGFTVRVGINTGLVVVAEVGTDLRVEYTAMGDAVNVASRMESAAEPGTILMTEETYKLLQGNFEVIPIGPISVKGKSSKINTFRLIGEKSINSNTKEQKEFFSPIVGRQSEIENILGILDGNNFNEGKIIKLVGECGIGKSRLALESKMLTRGKYEWIESKAQAYRKNNSYWFIKNLIINYLKEEANITDSAFKDKLTWILKKHLPTIYKEILPFLLLLLDLPTNGSNIRHIDEDDAKDLQGQIYYSVLELFKLPLYSQPVILLLEDLQWCDSASLHLLNELFVLVEKRPLSVFLTFRENEEVKLFANDLGKQIKLNKLDISESSQLVENLSGGINLPDELKIMTVEKAEGNPFFIEEVLRSIFEKHTMNNKAIKEINTKEKFEIPSLLQSAIMARLDYLPPMDKIVLQTASVIGRTFSKNILQSILKDSFNAREIEDSLQILQEKQFLLKIIDASIENSGITDIEFTFRQSLTQEVAYSSLLISNRQKMHSKIGETLENLYFDKKEQIAESLALHFEKSGSYEKSIVYCKIAADKSKSIYSNKEALYFYNKILSFDKFICIEKNILYNVYESMGDINLLTSNYSEAIKFYDLALINLNGTQDESIINYKIGQVYERWGQYEKSIQIYKQTLKTYFADHHKPVRIKIYIGLSMVEYRQGLYDQSILSSNKALELIGDSEYNYELADIYNNLGIVYTKLSDFKKALEYLLKSLTLRKSLGNLSGLSASYNNIGYLYQLQDKFRESIDSYKKSIELCQKIGNIHGLAKIYDNLSHIYLAQGHQESALDYNLKAIELYGKITRSSFDVSDQLWIQSGVW